MAVSCNSPAMEVVGNLIVPITGRKSTLQHPVATLYAASDQSLLCFNDRFLMVM